MFVQLHHAGLGSGAAVGPSTLLSPEVLAALAAGIGGVPALAVSVARADGEGAVPEQRLRAAAEVTAQVGGHPGRRGEGGGGVPGT